MPGPRSGNTKGWTEPTLHSGCTKQGIECSGPGCQYHSGKTEKRRRRRAKGEATLTPNLELRRKQFDETDLTTRQHRHLTRRPGSQKK